MTIVKCLFARADMNDLRPRPRLQRMLRHFGLQEKRHDDATASRGSEDKTAPNLTKPERRQSVRGSEFQWYVTHLPIWMTRSSTWAASSSLEIFKTPCR